MAKTAYTAGSIIRNEKEGKRLVERLKVDFRLEVAGRSTRLYCVLGSYMDTLLMAGLMEELDLELFCDPLPGLGHGWTFRRRTG